MTGGHNKSWLRAALCGLLLALFGLTWSEGRKPAPLAAPHETRADQLERGEALYLFHCTTCHGRQGDGLDEARLAFPEEHRVCERCHMPRNPRQLAQERMTPDYAFSVGVAPPLRGAGALSSFGTAGALYHYVRAAMPRQAPGSLRDEDYLDIVAFVLALGERRQEAGLGDEVLDVEGAWSIRLGTGAD